MPEQPSAYDDGLEQLAAACWLTTATQSALFQPQPALPFGHASNSFPTIAVDAGQQFQSMDGFGFALTGGSAYLINRLPTTEKEALLRHLFLTAGDGIGISCLRLSIGASDLSDRSFSYDDLPPGHTDPGLAQFNLAAGDVDVVPLLQDIVALKPDIRIIATPWSPPPWMKTNHSFIGGELKPEFYSVYADYLVKYLQAMLAKGIAIHAISPQNEPLNPDNDPSLLMEALAQADFIRKHLGPALRLAGLGDVEVFCWDHNCDRKDYPLTVLADPEVRQYISGVAWHLYAGDISVLSEVHAAYPEQKMYFTEQWVGSDGHFADDLRWHLKHVLIGATRNWSRAVLEWNLASQPYYNSKQNAHFHGPHTPGGCKLCLGALSFDGGISKNVAYYVIAHAAKFIPPGSVRICSNLPDGLPNVAFKTPEGVIVLLVLNDSDALLSFNIQGEGRMATASLDEGAVATFLWPSKLV